MLTRNNNAEKHQAPSNMRSGGSVPNTMNVYFTWLISAIGHVRVNFGCEISKLSTEKLVNCDIYLPVVRVYADSRSTCFPLPELARWNLVQSTKFLRVTVRSHVSTAPTMHESRHFIDPWTIDIISSFSLAIGTRWVQADILSSSFVVSLSFSRTLYSDEYKNSSCFFRFKWRSLT